MIFMIDLDSRLGNNSLLEPMLDKFRKFTRTLLINNIFELFINKHVFYYRCLLFAYRQWCPDLGGCHPTLQHFIIGDLVYWVYQLYQYVIKIKEQLLYQICIYATLLISLIYEHKLAQLSGMHGEKIRKYRKFKKTPDFIPTVLRESEQSLLALSLIFSFRSTISSALNFQSVFNKYKFLDVYSMICQLNFSSMFQAFSDLIFFEDGFSLSCFMNSICFLNVFRMWVTFYLISGGEGEENVRCHQLWYYIFERGEPSGLKSMQVWLYLPFSIGQSKNLLKYIQLLYSAQQMTVTIFSGLKFDSNFQSI